MYQIKSNMAAPVTNSILEAEELAQEESSHPINDFKAYIYDDQENLIAQFSYGKKVSDYQIYSL